MVQFPDEAHGVAAAVLMFSFISWMAGCVLIWLVWTHHERTSYVAGIAYFTLIATTTSIAQQIHLYVRWDDLMATQYDHTKENFGNPELIVSSSTTGIDLVLFYIRYASFTISATLVMFWGLFLSLSMYGFAERTHLYNTLALANVVGKLVSIIFPVTCIALLQLEAVQASFMGFLVLADLPLLIGLVGGCIFVAAIIRKYIKTRKQFRTWSLGYSWDFGKSHIYDRWLLVRFSIGFCILAIFNLTNILCQIAWHGNISRDVEADGPDLGAARARHDSSLFLPGVSSSLLAFVIFGTTTPFRKYMRKVFVDRWRSRPTQPPPNPSPLPPQTGYEVRVYGPNGPNTTVYAVGNGEEDIELQHTKPSNSISSRYTGSDGGRGTSRTGDRMAC